MFLDTKSSTILDKELQANFGKSRIFRDSASLGRKLTADATKEDVLQNRSSKTLDTQ